MVLAVLMWPMVSAQPDVQKASEQWWQWHHKRIPSVRADAPRRPLIPPNPKAAPSSKGNGVPLGERWVPGEWEEVQAVVLTPIYHYKPVGVASPSYWQADPLVTGWADLYEYARVSPTSRNFSWQYRGVGAYYGLLDTVEAQSQVPFYLMDAVQQGGAEAWVRVEQEADTDIVVRHLIAKGLRHDRLRFFTAPGNSFWYRDCGPICFYYGEADSIGMLDFQYYSGRALDDSLPTYISRSFGLPRYSSAVMWEGGNYLTDGAGTTLGSDVIYAANTSDTGQYVWDGVDINTLSLAPREPLGAAQVGDSLRHLLASREVHILPALQYDGGTGHIDLYADMLDENMFVVSNMPSRYSRWTDYGIIRRNVDSLTTYTNREGIPYRVAYLPFPSRDNGAYFASQTQYANYTRTYSNHLMVNQLLIQPCFSTVGSDGWPTAQWDKANIEQVAAAYPGYRIYCIDMRTYDGLGGAIHCLTKQIPVASPIRILHTPTVGSLTVMPAGDTFPIAAQITNNKGIARARLHFRINGGEWQQVDMRGEEQHRYASSIPLEQPTGGSPLKVDYYLSATNNDGKYITKPMTALQGGYFTFSLGDNGSIASVSDTAAGYGQFYPNPASDRVHIAIEVALGTEGKMVWYDAEGHVVFTRPYTLTAGYNCLTLSIGHLPSGVYTAVFTSGGYSVARKVAVY